MRETAHIEQQSLVDAIHENDEAILKQLYVANFKKVEAFILMNNGSPPQAKDTYQEAFIAVWRNVKEGKFTPENESALQGYLYRIAKNKWTDHLRSARFKKTKSMPDHLNAVQEETLDEHQNNERMEHLKDAFKQLGSPCRDLLTFFYFNKESVRDIAQRLKIGEASARNKKYRCMQKLKELALSMQ